MGLELHNVLSEERHHGSFICLICQNLIDLDGLVTTSCFHVFCRNCLHQWIDRPVPADRSSPYGPRDPTCPTCSKNLLYSQNDLHSPSMMIGDHNVTVQPLELCQPLAYRVLKRIKVRCPLQRVKCCWEGDYGDLDAHLLSKNAHCEVVPTKIPKSSGSVLVETVPMDTDEPPISAEPTVNSEAEAEEQNRALALSFKEEANDKFSSGHHLQARDLYTKALSVLSKKDPESRKIMAALFANRAATYLLLKRFTECITDCSEAMQLEPNYIKAYMRKGKALIQLGQFQQAITNWEVAMAICKHDSSQRSLIEKELCATRHFQGLMMEGMQQLNDKQYAKAKLTFGKLMRETTAAPIMLGAAQADLGMGLTESAMRISLQIIKNQPSHRAEGYELRARCLFLMGEFESGVKLFNEALRLAPDMSSARVFRKGCSNIAALVKQAKDAGFYRKFEQAVEQMDTAIRESQPLPAKAPLHSILHTQRAEGHLRLKNFNEALKDCAVVLYERDDYKPAWLIKFQALHGLGRHEEVLDEAADLMRKWGSSDDQIRRAYHNANFQVRKMKRADYYKLLRVSPVASEMEIKKAYRQRAKELHPDMFVGGNFTDKQRKEAAEGFQQLGDALEILCDDFKRRLYDEGYDDEAIKERVAAAQRAAHRQH